MSYVRSITLMRVWLIQVGETLPIDKGKGRLWRIGLLAETLLSRGHEVTWWTSTFNHRHKKHRYQCDTFVEVNHRYRIILLHGMTYKRNVSFQRILNHRAIAKKFFRLARKERAPHIILCGLPTLEFCAAATEFGAKHDIPVVLDIRDMWPDILLNVAPKWMEPVCRILIWPMFRSVSKSCSQASAIFGMTPAFVKKGLSYARRPQAKFDRDFPFGYSKEEPEESAISTAKEFWQSMGIAPQEERFIVCFFGALSKRVELETLIRAAHYVKRLNKDMLFVICGKGENSSRCKMWATGCDNTIFPGWIGFAEIWTLMQVSSVGVIPYPSTQDFMASIPNKAIEYLAGGLPIVSSIKGVMEDLLSTYECGLTYENKSPKDLASVLSRLFDNPTLLRTMSQNASKLFHMKFTAEKVYLEMNKCLEELSEGFHNRGRFEDR